MRSADQIDTAIKQANRHHYHDFMHPSAYIRASALSAGVGILSDLCTPLACPVPHLPHGTGLPPRERAAFAVVLSPMGFYILMAAVHMLSLIHI